MAMQACADSPKLEGRERILKGELVLRSLPGMGAERWRVRTALGNGFQEQGQSCLSSVLGRSVWRPRAGHPPCPAVENCEGFDLV